MPDMRERVPDEWQRAVSDDERGYAVLSEGGDEVRHLDLFSGIGGFALAVQWVWGDVHEIVSFCDNDKAAQVVLSKHWPGVPIHDDIKTLDATKWRGTVDLVTGGFPCQPFSCAGKRKGASDDRYLWPEMLRVIAECQPRWVLGENVPGIIGMELDKVLAGLEGEGYETGTLIVPACAVDAPHIRSRIWIVAHACGMECEAGAKVAGVLRALPTNESEHDNADRSSQDVADAAIISEREQTDETDALATCGRTRNESSDGGNVSNATGQQDGRLFERGIQADTCDDSNGRSEAATWPTEPALGRVANGVPYRVDRLRLLGNAIVPQVAAEIFRAMKAVDV
jgi:DNA (cytosine-5)-methyltransferase 1